MAALFIELLQISLLIAS